MMDIPERKSPTEALDLQRKIADTMSGKRPMDRFYPYFSPDYELPFTHIGTEKQLFVDNYMLDYFEGVERVFPEPQRPEKPVLIADHPWEERRFNAYSPTAAFYDEDEKKYKMWYGLHISDDIYQGESVTCYAESGDCLNWTKPLMDLGFPYRKDKATNIVHRDTDHMIVVLNPDKSNPEQKYLLVYNPSKKAQSMGKLMISHLASSPNGIHWTELSDTSPLPFQHGVQIIWDESVQKWIAYSQYSHHWHHGPRIRQIGKQESLDLIHWSPKEVVISPEWDPTLPPHMELGFMSIRKVGGLYLGIVDEYPCEPIWCVSDKGANWRDQTFIKMALYCSRDGKHWQRAVKDTWVDNREPGSMDGGIAGFSASGYLLHDGRMFIPYCGIPCKQWAALSPASKVSAPQETRDASIEYYQSFAESTGTEPLAYMAQRAIGMLILREDGWAMLKPRYEYGKAYTKQFVFEGNSLKVNVDCKYGCVKVEILDPHFKPYEGFSAEECDPMHDGDIGKIWHTVTWKGKSDVSSLWNKPVRIAFHLHEASIFAFQFVDLS